MASGGSRRPLGPTRTSRNLPRSEAVSETPPNERERGAVMALLPFAVVCLATFLVLHFWWIRRLRQAVRAEPSERVLSRAAKLALFRYVRAVALVGLVTSVSVALGVTLLRIQSPTVAKAPAVRAAMTQIHDAKRSLDGLYPYWFATAGLLVTIGLGVYTYRRRHIQCSAAFQAAGQAEFDRLVEAMKSDPSWWDLPPNAEMVNVWSEYQRLDALLPSLPEHQKQAAQQQMEQLRQIFLQLDVFRRMNVRLDPDAVEDAEPETWRDWLACLIGGRRLLGSVGLGTRVLYHANMTLLILGLIGFSASGVYQALDDRLIGLQDLQVRIQRLEGLEQKVAEAEEETKPQSNQSIPNVRFASRLGDVGRRAAQVQAKLVEAKASRASALPVDEKIKDLGAELKSAAVRDKQQRDLMAEIRKATEEPPAGPRRRGFEARTSASASPPCATDWSASLPAWTVTPAVFTAGPMRSSVRSPSSTPIPG